MKTYNFSFAIFLLLISNQSLFAQNTTSNRELSDPVIKRLYEKNGSYENFDPNKELIDKRTLNSKTFYLGGTDYKGLYVAGEIHYLENGELKTSSNEIVSSNMSGFKYENRHNLVKSYYGNKIEDGVKFVKNDRTASLHFEGLKLYNQSKNFISNYFEFNNVEANHIDYSNKVKYDFSNISVSIEQQTGSVKSFYEISSNIFGVDTTGYIGFAEILNFDENVSFEKDTKSNKIIFINSEGLQLMSYGDLNYFSKDKFSFNKVEYLIEAISETSFKVTSLIPKKWLCNPLTSYPVIIDPTTTFYPNAANFWTGTWDSDCNGYTNGDAMYLGREDRNWTTCDSEYHCYAKFNLAGLTACGTLTNISSVNLEAYQNSWTDGSGNNYNQFDVGWLNLDPVPSSWATIGAGINGMTERYSAWNVWGASSPCNGCNGGWDYDENSNGWKNFNIDYDIAKFRVFQQMGSYMTFGFDSKGTPTSSASDEDNYIGFSGQSSSNRPRLTVVYNAAPIAVTGTVSHESTSPCSANGAISSVGISGGASNVRYIKIIQMKGDWFNVAEVQAIEVFSGTNVAAGLGGSQSSCYLGNCTSYGVNKLTDGNNATFYHSNSTLKNEWAQIDLGAEFDLDRIRILNRQDCCMDRESNILVILKDGSGNVLKSYETGLSTTVGVWNEYNVLDASWNDGATTLNRTGLNPSCSNSTYTLTVNSICTNGSNAFVVNDGVQTSGNPSVFGANQWNVYAYAGNNLNLSGICYYGYYVESSLSFNTTSRWAAGSTPATASGYVGCDPGIDYHTIVSKRQGFPCGTYQIDVSAHDDEARLYIDGVQVWEHIGCCDAHTNVWTGTLTSTSTVEFRHAEGVGGSYQALTFTLLNSNVAPTSVSGGGTFCHGNSVTLTANGGSLGPGASYNWYTGSCGGTLVYTGNPYTFTASSTNTYYVRVEGTCGNTTCTSTTVTLPINGTALATNGQSATCVVNAWETVDFYHSSGNYIASVSAGASSLGSTTATAFVDGVVDRVPACVSPFEETSVMQRHWVITPTTQGVANVRLPYTSTELSTLSADAALSSSPYDAVSVQADLKLSKYAGDLTPNDMAMTNINVDANPDNNCPAAGGTGLTSIHDEFAFGSIPVVGINAMYSDFSIPGFSEFWLHGSLNTSPLPIELSSFIANCIENKVMVQWVTASEQNSSHFVLERSINGFDWLNIANIQAAGNSTNMTNYQFVDDDALVRSYDVIYYRLIQFDNDGKSKMYGPATATCKSEKFGMEIFPNPAHSQVNIVLHGDYNNETNIVFTDIQGKVVKQFNCEPTKGKSYIVDVQSLAPGVYFVRLMDVSSDNQIIRFVKR